MTKTFKFQNDLNTLPIPSLKETCDKYLEWVEPLINKEQYKETKHVLTKFINNEGLILQKKLKNWSEQNKGSWLRPLWDNMYLCKRESNAININYFIKIITDHLKDDYSSFEIAALIIGKLMDIYEDIINERLEPERIKGKPLCMEQYKKIFKAIRLPKPNCDQYIVGAKTENNHIVLVYKSNMFKMELTDGKGERFSYRSIARTLETLTSTVDFKWDINLGVITTAPRNMAALLLDKVLSIKENHNNFEVLKEAVFIVCLDENTKDLREFALSLLCSKGENRYFDKSCQLVFNRKGDVGFNFEHTGADGTPWINVLEQVCGGLENIENCLIGSEFKEIELKKLKWYIPEEIKHELQGLKIVNIYEAENIHMEIVCFKDFGKGAIKNSKCSPDAFFHLALQLAQYRVFNRFRSILEAVSTRFFLYGRTECNRPVNMEAVEFIKSFERKNCDELLLRRLMDKALNRHYSRIRDCQAARGVERHLFGLLSMYRMFGQELGIHEIPKLFQDEAYRRLKHDFIATSRMEGKYIDLAGFSPVAGDGFGLWYSIREGQINMCLTTKQDVNRGCVKLFADSIVKALRDLKRFSSK